MKTINTAFLSLFLAFLLGFSTASQAAATTCTEPDSECQAELSITVNLLQQVEVSGLQDVGVDRDQWNDGEQGFSAPVKSFCIYSNDPSGKYNITFTGKNSASGNSTYPFQLINDQTPSLEGDFLYRIKFRDDVNTFDAGYGVPIQDATGASGDPTFCPAGGKNVSMQLAFVSKSPGLGHVDGTYADTLTILVTPPT